MENKKEPRILLRTLGFLAVFGSWKLVIETKNLRLDIYKGGGYSVPLL